LQELEMGPYQIVAATRDDINWIAIKAREIYGPLLSIPVAVKLSWFEKFPSGFWMIKDRTGGNVGSFELLPLRKAAIESLADGTKKECKLTKKDIDVSSEPGKIDTFYVENVMSVNKNNEPNQWAFIKFIRTVPLIIKRLGVDPSHVTLYAMPIRQFTSRHGKRNSPSEEVLLRLGFNVISKRAKQRRLFYSARLDNVLSTLSALLKEIS
jgi:hypothetical protein